MKIAYIGNFGPSFSTENHVRRTFEKMGHQIVCVQENSFGAIALRDELLNINPDLVLYTRTWGVDGMDKDFFRSLPFPSASYHLDLYMGISREAGIADDPFWNTTYVFTVDGDPESARKFKELGINHFYMRAGVVDDEAYMAEPDHARFPEEVVFVGSYGYHPEWPHRQQLVDFLRETYGSRFGKHGNPDDTIREHDLNVLYASSKVVAGDSLTPNFTHKGYSTDRIFETTGRGGFLLFPRIEGMTDAFEDGKEIVYYDFNDWEALKAKIDYYLSHDDEREAIRRAGFRRAKRDHTYNVRLQGILEKIAEFEPTIKAKL